MTDPTEPIGETIPETCPECGREPLAIIHDTGKASLGYEVNGTYCFVDGGVVDTAYHMDELYYVHDG